MMDVTHPDYDPKKDPRYFVEKPRTDPLIIEGRELLAQWGDFVELKAKLAELVEQDLGYLPLPGRTRLRSIISKNKIKLLEMASYVPKKPVDWPDHHVVHAVKTLTALDQDRCRDPNRMGWGKATSPIGHWCYAMLKIDRVRAIEVARGVVGKHRRQLQEPHIRAVYPLPAGWEITK